MFSSTFLDSLTFASKSSFTFKRSSRSQRAKALWIVLALAMTLVPIGARAQNEVAKGAGAPAATRGNLDIEKHPYVMLYRAREAGTRAMLARSKAEAEFARLQFNRLRLLYARAAVSLEEFQESEMRLAAAQENIRMNQALVEESEALLALARERVLNGQDMPIHTLPLYPR